jgi:hypothetical protein
MGRGTGSFHGQDRQGSFHGPNRQLPWSQHADCMVMTGSFHGHDRHMEAALPVMTMEPALTMEAAWELPVRTMEATLPVMTMETACHDRQGSFHGQDRQGCSPVRLGSQCCV